MKRIIAFVLLAAMLISLTACGAHSQEETTEQEKLIAILDDAVANIHPGTAGSMLRAIKVAVALIKFAGKTDMTKQEAAKTVTEWMAEQSAENQDVIREQLQEVGEAYGKIALDGAKELLKNAGESDNLGEMSDQLMGIVESILASGGVN